MMTVPLERHDWAEGVRSLRPKASLFQRGRRYKQPHSLPFCKGKIQTLVAITSNYLVSEPSWRAAAVKRGKLKLGKKSK